MVEGVIKRNGRYEVNPAIMKKVEKSIIKGMSEEDVKTVIVLRNEYLRWMHDNFAKKIIKPPKNNQ
ncbi:MAG: hypothetical protein ACLPY5_13150 [Candidatus Bathyarchaeia archaeon]